MKATDLDALEKLADKALPYWFAVDIALGGNPIAADLVAPFAASVSPATIKALIAELREARGLLKRTDPFTSSLAIGASELRSDIRAFLAKAQGGE